MANIIRRARIVGVDRGEFEYTKHAEVEVDHNGTEVFVSMTVTNRFEWFFVTEESILERLILQCYPARTQVTEEYGAESVVDPEEEDKMAHSEYYSVFLYLYDLSYLISRSSYIPKEYTEDIGKDTDEMYNLTPICRIISLQDCFRTPYPEYSIVNVRNRRFGNSTIRPLHAEAFIIDRLKPVYVEAIWTQENPNVFTFEVNDYSIYQLINRRHPKAVSHLAKIRETGMVYPDMKSALEDRYGRVCLLLMSKLIHELREVHFFKRYNYKREDIPAWYRIDTAMRF